MILNRQNINVGADIEEIERFRNLKQSKDKFFLDKIYTQNELVYCFKKSNPGPHLAGRFAAKEAIFKALSAAEITRVPLKKIEILANMDGVPRVIVHGFEKNKLEVNVSISHCASWAMAFALAVSYEKPKRKNRSK